MASPQRSASIIVPTYREAPNIRPLVERAFAALEGASREAEIIIVDDDSRDGIEEIVAELAERYPVRIIVRREDRGLSSAVLAGFREARHDRFLVLDADLQHPPEMIPALLDRLEEPGCDFVIGTRYGDGGGIAGHWPLSRRFASRLATLLARPLTRLSDPMSGFFALRRDTWEQAATLNPVGYKIALELCVKARCRQPGEVPIRFEIRQAGTSKFGLREQWQYALHLLRLYRFRFPALTIATLVAASIALVAAIAWLARVA